MSSIQSSNLFLLVGALSRLIGNRTRPVNGVRSCCNTLKSKRCHGNNNVKASLYSLSFDMYCMYLFSEAAQKLNFPELKKL